MAVWKVDYQDPGFNLVQNGFVAMFRSPRVLDDAISTFRASG
ncbi:hypothetical protein [Leifsonia sp. LS-T14]